LAGHSLADDLRGEAVQALQEGAVVELVRPTDSQVHALYSLAEALLFPSKVEGFGLPILEAQACGCPVFASDRAPLPEVGGNGAVYFDPDNPQSAATTILDAWSARPALIQRGEANVAVRTTNQMAETYAQVYRTILEKPTR
jgi:glycosyltransferase involved in cell wall biosynthesis